MNNIPGHADSAVSGLFATFNSPTSLVFDVNDPNHTVYIADYGNSEVRKLTYRTNSTGFYVTVVETWARSFVSQELDLPAPTALCNTICRCARLYDGLLRQLHVLWVKRCNRSLRYAKPKSSITTIDKWQHKSTW